MKQNILLSVHPFLGDVAMLTVIVKYFHKYHGDKFNINVDVPDFLMGVFSNNPYINRSVNHENTRLKIRLDYSGGDEFASKGHSILGFTRKLENFLGLEIPIEDMSCDIHLLEEERNNFHGRYWILNAGYKNNIQTKHYPIEHFQKVVDLLSEKIKFIQVGSSSDIHRHLSGTTDMIGKTSVRELIRLIYHSKGVLTPISAHAHLATMESNYPRPSVIVAGGRESSSLFQYNHSKSISRVGFYDCCKEHGCLKRNNCSCMVKCESGFCPKCMFDINPEQIVDAVLYCEKYY